MVLNPGQKTLKGGCLKLTLSSKASIIGDDDMDLQAQGVKYSLISITLSLRVKTGE